MFHTKVIEKLETRA